MKPWRYLLFCLLLAPLAGCLDVETRIVVAANGSGTITERMELKGPMAQMMRQMESEKGGFADREQVEAHAKELGEGVRVISLTELEQTEGVGAIAVFGFDDVTRLKVRQNPMEGRDGAPAGKSPGSGGKPPAEMRFRFEPGSPAVLTLLLSRPAVSAKRGKSSGSAGGKGDSGVPQEKPDPTAEKMLAGFKEMLKGMRMAISVEVDGTIVETNATYREGNRLTILELEMDKLLEADPDSAAALKPGSDMEAMKKALAGVPGVKVELEPEVRVVFKPGTVLAAAPERPAARPLPGSL